MVRITEDLVRKSAEHNDGILSTLEEVALHQRDIEKIEYLGKWCPELKILDLTSNLIPRIENLGRLKKLEYLKLGLNNIERVENLEGCESLQKLDLTVNFIGELTSIECLQGLINLRELYLTGNPCTKYENYRPFVVGTLSQLERFDGLEITKSERILAFQALFQIKDEVIEQQRRHFIKREKEKIRENQIVDDNDNDDVDDEEVERRFWNEPTEFTPESRNRIYQHKQKGKDKHQEEQNNSTSQRKLQTTDGRRLNINEPKVKFELTEDEKGRNLVLDVALFKFLDTSLCNVDVHPTYVQVIIKDKMLQIALSEEVNAEKSVAQRSQASGRLLIIMPKVNPQLTYLAKFSLLPRNKHQKKDESRIKKLEVDPLCQKTVDLNICQKNVSTAKMRSTDLRNLKEKENSEGFVDDDNVPPLESF